MNCNKNGMNFDTVQCVKMDISHKKTWENLPLVTKAHDFLVCSFCKTSLIFGPWNTIFSQSMYLLVYSCNVYNCSDICCWMTTMSGSEESIKVTKEGWLWKRGTHSFLLYFRCLWIMKFDMLHHLQLPYILNRFCPRELIALFIH